MTTELAPILRPCDQCQDSTTLAYRDMVRAYVNSDPTEFNKALATPILFGEYYPERRAGGIRVLLQRILAVLPLPFSMLMFVLVVAHLGVFAELIARLSGSASARRVSLGSAIIVHVFARPAAHHQPLFDCHLHRLGLRADVARLRAFTETAQATSWPHAGAALRSSSQSGH